MKVQLAGIFLFLFSLSTFGQQPDTRHRFNARATCSVPSPIVNRAFKKTFIGVFDVTTTAAYNYYKGLFVGGVGKATLLKIPPNKIPNLTTTMEMYAAGGKLGYDLYVGNNAFLTMGVNAGMNWTKYSSVSCYDPVDYPFKYETYFIEPELIMSFFIENKFAVGINVSYNMMQKSFDPYFLCLDDHAAYRDYELGGPTTYLDVGFGFYYGFSKRKRSGDGTNNSIKGQ